MVRVEFSRVIRARREKVFGVITDFENLPRRLPTFFKSIKVLSRAGNTMILDEVLQIGERTIRQTTKHTMHSPERHEVEVLAGDAEGTRITESYVEVDEGTRVDVVGELKFKSALGKLVGPLAKGRIKDSMEKVMKEAARIIEESAS